MERKNYLVEELSEDEKKYMICAIKKAYLSAIRKYIRENRYKKYSIDDINIQEKIPTQEDCYFPDGMNLFNSWNYKKPFSKAQRDICVQKLNELAIKFELDRYIKTLTYNEQLVFFLLEMQLLPIKRISFLINIDRKTVRARYKCAKNKIEEAKNKYGR